MRGKYKVAVAAALLAALAAVLTSSLGGSASPRAGAVRAQSHELAASSVDTDHTTKFDRTIATFASSGMNVRDGVFQGVSPAVSGLPNATPNLNVIDKRDNENLARTGQASTGQDPVVQKKAGGGSATTAPIANFDGQCSPANDVPTCATKLSSSCGCLPPDTNGEAGDTQYVQMVNSDFAVFTKSGGLLKGATDMNSLWANTNGECKIHNDGDPVVMFDQLAHRWLLSQFIATPSGNQGDDQYGECIAISTSPDATGTYYLYEFDLGNTTFFDYPHFGVWPDGYYMTANAFDGTTSLGVGGAAFAFERSKMLQGQSARVVYFQESSSFGGQLPADLDGLKPPPGGSPDAVAEVDDPSTVADASNPFAMRIWKFKVNWTTPQSSTFGNNGDPNYTLPVDPFVRPQCVYGDAGTNCTPQKGTAEGLDTIGDRLMFRLAYRNFGTGGESLVLNHTVSANGVNGIRWYEVRNPLGRNGQPPTILQSGTYAPGDGMWRWMGSIAMDKSGDIALGYSASSPTDFPSVRYTGRLAGDPVGQMTQMERVAYTGQGPQTQAEGRWGDYSDLTVDPSDDCTFFYTQEYLVPHSPVEEGVQIPVPVSGRWATRIVSFKFPQCGKPRR